MFSKQRDAFSLPWLPDITGSGSVPAAPHPGRGSRLGEGAFCSAGVSPPTLGHGGSSSPFMRSIQIPEADLHNAISRVPWLRASPTSSSGRARAEQTSLMK